MARPKEFDRDEALDRALAVFWSKGFEATSVQDLVEATGVQRQSLYDTFGDKGALYLSALTRYAETSEGWARSLEKPVGSPLSLLRKTFHQVATESAADPRGCFIVSAAQERACSAPEVKECVHGSIQRMERAFVALIKQAQAAGEVPASVSPRATARTLVTMLWGFRAMARGEASESWLRSVVDHVLGLITTPAD
ncbi:MAG: TetR/AcrR family transcriptional regulator [Polyangiaceae bacterium]